MKDYELWRILLKDYELWNMDRGIWVVEYINCGIWARAKQNCTNRIESEVKETLRKLTRGKGTGILLFTWSTLVWLSSDVLSVDSDVGILLRAEKCLCDCLINSQKQLLQTRFFSPCAYSNSSRFTEQLEHTTFIQIKQWTIRTYYYIAIDVSKK